MSQKGLAVLILMSEDTECDRKGERCLNPSDEIRHFNVCLKY